ncbi:Inner kinetochore subunit cnp20 [Cladobotryum mycophilum]|uniref:Inner kinetochore subunit cnp20 n=1 Tax=Cladobotryum mycophilum TaxID=491253 RepID=A0ABR0T360_9HYPO
MDTTPTPYGNRLNGRTPAITPNRRAISLEPPSSRRSIHTPLDRSLSRDLLNSIRRGTPGRSNAPTPHAKAARRALDQRRNAMFTPGKNRRRSLRIQRETPMDILRNLGRALAPKTQPIITSSSSPVKNSPSVLPLPDDDDDELPIDRPRLSLPLDDDDDSDLHPHRSSMLDEGNYTVQSIELPRRAISEQPSRMSLGGFGSDGVSDFIMNNDPTEGLGRQSDFFPGLLEDIQAREEDEADFTYERIEVEPARRMTMGGRESDFNLEMPAGLDDQTTFMMSELAPDAESTIRIVEHSFAEAAGNEAREYPDGDVLSDDDDGYQGYGDYGDYEIVDDEDNVDTSEAIVEVEDNGQRAETGDIAPKSGKKRNRVSSHGIEFPPLPPSFVKRVAHTALQSSGLSNSRISPDTLEALTQASEWFFEQLGDDLGAYASHAKRKTIEEGDIITLMRRQRQIGGDSTMFSLAQRHLPRELLQELRMPVPQLSKQPRGKRKQQDDDQDESEIT